ncbi:MAG: hypothetical protein FWG74_08030 [Planctomycetes bacterium]|nr:hypothetical protein [Planctomycetota bacterium]
MRHPASWLFVFLVFVAAGCSNPIAREPANVFPGSDSYAKRVQSFKIQPAEAHDLALNQARKDNNVQFVSRRPTVVVKRWYVFSLPQASGASSRGYHVNGDTGEVKFMKEDKAIAHTKR